MLVSHARFLAQVNEAADFRLIETFQEKVKSLEQFPERNPVLIAPLITPGKYRKILLEKRYLLIYQIKEIEDRNHRSRVLPRSRHLLMRILPQDSVSQIMEYLILKILQNTAKKSD